MPAPTDAPSRGPVFAYRPALDGLRAIAVTGVLLFHGGVGWLPGGFLGVDAFFVLSGFLITSLLLTERIRTGHIRLGRFWLRRVRRLLPALVLVLVTVVVVFRRLLAPVELSLLRGDALSALGYVANWRMIYRGDDYFAQTSAPSPLQHTWSLGIEEQFYLVWPLLVVGLFALAALLAFSARKVSRVLAVVCVLGATASAVACALVFQPENVNRAYFGTDTRAEALLIGCALAAVLTPRRRKTSAKRRPAGATARTPSAAAAPKVNRPNVTRPNVTRPKVKRPKVKRPAVKPRTWGGIAVATAGMFGAFVVAWLWTHVGGTDAALFRGGLGLDALAVAAVLAYVVTIPDDPLARVLSLTPVVWLGRISYGVYLWHWPLFALLTAGRTGLDGPGLLSVRLGVTLAVAAASYVLVEEPIRLGRWPWPVRAVPDWHLRPLATVVSVVGLVGVTGVVVLAGTAVPSRPPAKAVYAVPTVASTVSPTVVAPVRRAGRKPGAAARITFFGDSVSWTLGTYLPPHPGLAVTVRAIQGCGIARLPELLQLGTGGTNYPGCDTWDARWRRGVNADDPDVSVILLDRWELMDRYLGDGYHHVGQPVFDVYLAHELDLAISIAGSRGAQVVLLTAPYTHRAERPDGGLYDEDLPERVDAWNRLLYQAQAKDPTHITVIDLNGRVCPTGTFTWSIGQLQIRSDGLHFTEDGVQRYIAPWLLPQLADVALGLPATPPTLSPTPRPPPTSSPTPRAVASAASRSPPPSRASR